MVDTLALTGKMVLGVDADDVIFDTQKGGLDFARRELGRDIPSGNINDFAFWAGVGLSPEEALDLMHGYEHEGHPGLELKPGVLDFFAEHSSTHELHIVTARALCLVDVTIDAVNDYGLADFVSGIHHSRNSFFGGSALTKPEICQKIGASVLFDDSVANAVDCRNYGVNGVVVGRESWQLETLAHPDNKGILRIDSLPEAPAILATTNGQLV